MQCTEYLELEELYASAARRWAMYAQPQGFVEPGDDQLERARKIRLEALVERNSAAECMHLHRLNCRRCKVESKT
jgi:hypothetical protein